MHPDTRRLAAYLDGALPQRERDELRAHLLTCARCAGRLQQLRADATRITNTFDTLPAPDVRPALRARRRRWNVGQRWALAGAFVLMIVLAAGVLMQSAQTAGQRDAVLAVSDNRHGRLLALDAATSATLAEVAVGERPTLVRYDAKRNRAYVLTAEGVTAIATRAWEVVGQWRAPQQLAPGGIAGLALDEAAGLLYTSQPAAGAITVLDAETLAEHELITAIAHPGPLALLPDGRSLAVLDEAAGALWSVALPSGQPQRWSLGDGATQTGRRGWLAAAPDGQSIVVLWGVARDGQPPELWRVNLRTGQTQGPQQLAASPPPQDLAWLDSATIAVARGDGSAGGVELRAASDLGTQRSIDPEHDAHTLVVAPHDLFVLNWSHNTVARYAHDGALQWRITLDSAQPRGGVLIPR